MEEMEYKSFLAEHARDVLPRVGITEGSTILDFGCGSGDYVIPAARLVGSGTVYALDSNAEVLETVRTRCSQAGLKNVEMIQSSDLDTRLPTAWVDTILLFDVIHAVDDPRRLLQELDRVLRPGGTVAVYPMHVDNAAVTARMQKIGFELASEHYDGHILCFKRSSEMQDALDDEAASHG